MNIGIFLVIIFAALLHAS